MHILLLPYISHIQSSQSFDLAPLLLQHTRRAKPRQRCALSRGISGYCRRSALASPAVFPRNHRRMAHRAARICYANPLAASSTGTCSGKPSHSYSKPGFTVETPTHNTCSLGHMSTHHASTALLLHHNLAVPAHVWPDNYLSGGASQSQDTRIFLYSMLRMWA